MKGFSGKLNWPPGAILRGKILEQTEENYWIVSLGGKLFGVRNDSEKKLKEGLMVELEVLSQSPYQFRILGPCKSERKGINVRI